MGRGALPAKDGRNYGYCVDSRRNLERVVESLREESLVNPTNRAWIGRGNHRSDHRVRESDCHYENGDVEAKHVADVEERRPEPRSDPSFGGRYGTHDGAHVG